MKKTESKKIVELAELTRRILERKAKRKADGRCKETYGKEGRRFYD